MPKRKPEAIHSLLELPIGWETSTSLDVLKKLAHRAGLESGWQKIGKCHRKELVSAVSDRVSEWRSFVSSVRPVSEAVEAGQATLRRDLRCLKSPARRSEKSQAFRDDKHAALSGILAPAIDASIHLVPSGSGVHLGDGFVLTCAHCVDHDVPTMITSENIAIPTGDHLYLYLVVVTPMLIRLP